FLLTSKPVLYVANIAEEDMADPEQSEYYQQVKKFAEDEGSQALAVSARTEEEIAELPDDEKQEFLEAEGVEESGLDRLIRASYKLLGLATFFTAGGKETRARSEEHTSELQSRFDLVCRLLLEKKKITNKL